MKKFVKKLLDQFGIDISRRTDPNLDSEDLAIVKQVRDFTMTSQERILAVIDSTRYLSRNNVPGAIVECGVWRGGSSMAAALTLLQEQDVNRDFYLFDTFTGMTKPTDKDISFDGGMAIDQFPSDRSNWCAADLEDVKSNMLSTSFPRHRLHFIVGRVEETITPAVAPDQIALLRLDTDWYESTHHELVHFFPRLSKGGILIIDDYGHWQGARKAVDEYFANEGLKYLLQRIDYSGRLVIKTELVD
jgi:O-methyltransferase